MPLICKKPVLSDFRWAKSSAGYKIPMHKMVRGAIARTFFGIGDGWCLCGRDEDGYVYLYNAQKTNAKYEHGAKCKTQEWGGNKYPKGHSKKIRDAKWDVSVYRVPRSMIKSCKQFTNHFILELK